MITTSESSGLLCVLSDWYGGVNSERGWWLGEDGLELKSSTTLLSSEETRSVKLSDSCSTLFDFSSPFSLSLFDTSRSPFGPDSGVPFSGVGTRSISSTDEKVLPFCFGEERILVRGRIY